MRGPLLRATAAALAVIALAGCSWRLESAPPDWPSPGPVTQMRDTAAARESAVLEAALSTAGDGGAVTAQAAVLSELEAAGAPARLEALGGLYVPYPEATPTASPSTAPPDVIGLAMEARDGHLADALTAEDASLALLTASAGLAQALALWHADWVADAISQSSQPMVAERRLDSTALPEATAVPDSPQLSAETITDLVVRHDQARYTYEVLAARAEGEERGQWLARRDLQEARAGALVALPGVEDRREAVYMLPGSASADAGARLATARAIETATGETYAALLDGADAADIPWLLHAAFDAYAQAAAFGEPTAEAFTAPALPGIATAAR